MKFTIWLMAFLCIVLLVPATQAQFAGGTGSEEDPYQIGTIEQLQAIRDQRGESGYTAFRVVAMVVSQHETILAFTEGRQTSWRDDGAMDDIVLKRSIDGGKTWGPLIVVAEDGQNSCKDPVPVVLPSGRIILIYQLAPYTRHQTERVNREVHMVYSDDDGLTWSKSHDITGMIYPDDRRWSGTGPGHGLVKELEPHKGRIIIPARISPSSHIIYSDDDGQTWHRGSSVPMERTNEATAVELSNGDIMLNSRIRDENNPDVSPYRVVSISSDGGETWDEIYVDKTLVEPEGCQASLLKHSMNEETGKYNILFTNPHSSRFRVRVHGSIKLSPDDGRTWAKMYKYSDPYPRYSGYSDIQVINEGGDIGILWESGAHFENELRWDGIAFKTIKFSDINNPIDAEHKHNYHGVETPYSESTPNPHPTKDYVWVFDARPKHYIQVADIDASETENWNDGEGFEPIGDFDNTFTGWYNGNGYKIKNLNINRPGEDGIGLFGWAGGGEITNVILENVNITGGDMTGGMVGRLTRGKISNSQVTGAVSGRDQVGGLVGLPRRQSPIINSQDSAYVSGGN